MAAEKPDSLEKAAPSFAAVPHRIMFIGHYHRWLVVSNHKRSEGEQSSSSETIDNGRVIWDATTPLYLDPEQRFLVVVGPLVSSQFGVYDTNTNILTPFRC
jgi:hypothetical protein